MNLGMILLLFVVVAGSIMCLAFIGSQATATNVTDTYGSGMSSATNNTTAAVQGVLATGQTVSGGVIILVALIIGAIVLLGLLAGLLAVATRKF